MRRQRNALAFSELQTSGEISYGTESLQESITKRRRSPQYLKRPLIHPCASRSSPPSRCAKPPRKRRCRRMARGLGHFCGELSLVEFSRTPGPRRGLASSGRSDLSKGVPAGASMASGSRPGSRETTAKSQPWHFHRVSGALSGAIQNPSRSVARLLDETDTLCCPKIRPG